MLMPETAAIVDAFRAEFGELNAISAQENGHVVHWVKS